MALGALSAQLPLIAYLPGQQLLPKTETRTTSDPSSLTVNQPGPVASGFSSTSGVTSLQHLLTQMQTQHQVQLAAQRYAQDHVQIQARQHLLQVQEEKLRAQHLLVVQLAQALAASKTSLATQQYLPELRPVAASIAGRSPSASPVSHCSLSWPTNTSETGAPKPDGMKIHGEWVSQSQFLRIYSLRSKQTCGSSSLDQAAAGRSMVVASIFNLPPKSVRDIWARKVGAEWTYAGWTERERHIHASHGSKTSGEEERNAGKKRKASMDEHAPVNKLPRLVVENRV